MQFYFGIKNALSIAAKTHANDFCGEKRKHKNVIAFTFVAFDSLEMCRLHANRSRNCALNMVYDSKRVHFFLFVSMCVCECGRWVIKLLSEWTNLIERIYNSKIARYDPHDDDRSKRSEKNRKNKNKMPPSSSSNDQKVIDLTKFMSAAQ